MNPNSISLALLVISVLIIVFVYVIVSPIITDRNERKLLKWVLFISISFTVIVYLLMFVVVNWHL